MNDNKLTKVTVAAVTAAYTTIHTESFLEDSYSVNRCDSVTDNDVQAALERALRTARLYTDDLSGLRLTVEFRKFERPDEEKE